MLSKYRHLQYMPFQLYLLTLPLPYLRTLTTSIKTTDSLSHCTLLFHAFEGPGDIRPATYGPCSQVVLVLKIGMAQKKIRS